MLLIGAELGPEEGPAKIASTAPFESDTSFVVQSLWVDQRNLTRVSALDVDVVIDVDVRIQAQAQTDSIKHVRAS